MTFDRFGHEGTEAGRTAHGVRYCNNRLVAIDEVEHNDFWWAAEQPLGSACFVSSGHSDLMSDASMLPAQLRETTSGDLRTSGKTYLEIGASREASLIFVALWTRNNDPLDAFYAAFAFLESNQPAACAAFMEIVLAADISNADRAIASFAQGLAFRNRGLFDASAESFNRAMEWSNDDVVTELARKYLIEAQFRGEKWTDAASLIDAIDTSTAMSIRRELRKDLPWRSPALSGTMSAILPGFGQMYCGRYQEGVWAFVVVSVFALASCEALDRDLEWVVAATTLTGLSWYAGNIYGAISAGHKYNRRARESRVMNWVERLGVQQDNSGLKLMFEFQF